MRLLQLAIGPAEILDLHPHVTVVVGLDEDGRTLLVETVSGLARSQATQARGLLEAHGVLFDLDQTLVGVLEPAADDLDPIVRPGHLPTQPISVDARELQAREQAFSELLRVIAAQAEKQSQARDAVSAAAAAVEAARRARSEAARSTEERRLEAERLDRRRKDLEAELGHVEEQLKVARTEHAAAEAARTEALERTANVRRTRDEAIELLAGLEAELAAADAAIFEGAAEELQRARAQLADVEAQLEAERRAEREAQEAQQHDAQEAPAVTLAELDDRLAVVDARLAELDQLLIAVSPLDHDVVAKALAVVQGGQETDLVPSPEAQAVADELDRLTSELGDPRVADLAAHDVSLAEARARLEDARQRLLEAEQAVRTPRLDRDEVDRLEDAHAALLDAMDRAERRFAGSRAAARVEELRAAEAEILERLGFRSYSDYMMGSSLHEVDPALEAELDAARAELAAAEDAWQQADALTGAALSRAAKLDRRRELLGAARRLLASTADGPPQAALRALRVPALSLKDAARTLESALDAVGLDLAGEELDHEELALVAETWLGQAEHVADRHRDAQEERHALAAERASLVDQRDQLAATEDAGGAATDEPEPDPEEDRTRRLVAARERLAAAEASVARNAAAEAARQRVQTDLATAGEMAAVASEAAGEADAEVTTAADTVRSARERAMALQRRTEGLSSELASIDHALASAAAAPDVAALDAGLAAATEAHAAAIAQVETEDRALAALDAEGSAAALEIERLQDIVAAQGSGSTTPAEELEWYLLARLAAQRSVSIAGSLPLVLDDALRGLHGDEVRHLLGRLERMAEAVQVIVISADPVVAGWAEEAGPARAAVVRPVSP